MEQLTQKWLIKSRTYNIKKDVLAVIEKDLFNVREREIPLDEISPYLEKRKERQGRIASIIILATIVFILFLLNSYELLMAIAFPLLYIILDKDTSIIELRTKRETLYIFGNRPNHVAVDTFINTLFTKQKEYLIWKYGTLDADLDFDIQIANFRKLREYGYPF